MSIEPKYPKVLKQKLGPKEIDFTASRQSVCCGGFSHVRSPNKTGQNEIPKHNIVLGNFKEATSPSHNVKNNFRSTSPPLPLGVVQVHPRPYMSPQKPRQERVRHLSPQAQIQKENRRIVGVSEQQRAHFRLSIDEFRKKLQGLEIENYHLKQQNQMLERQKVEGDRIIRMYNQKFSEAQKLRLQVALLSATVTGQQSHIEYLMKPKSQIVQSITMTPSQVRQALGTVAFPKEVVGALPLPESIQSKISEKGTYQERSCSESNHSAFSPSKVRMSVSIEDQMRNLRSVYQKDKSTSKSDIQSSGSQVSVYPTQKLSVFRPQYVESIVQGVAPSESSSVCIADIRQDLNNLYSDIVKRIGEESEDQRMFKRTV